MFEGRLAWRYIRKQKRHSILTMYSIAVALTMMTFLFTLFTNIVGCCRSVAMLQGNYHYTIGN